MLSILFWLGWYAGHIFSPQSYWNHEVSNLETAFFARITAYRTNYEQLLLTQWLDSFCITRSFIFKMRVFFHESSNFNISVKFKSNVTIFDTFMGFIIFSILIYFISICKSVTFTRDFFFHLDWDSEKVIHSNDPLTF